MFTIDVQQIMIEMRQTFDRHLGLLPGLHEFLTDMESYFNTMEDVSNHTHIDGFVEI